VSSGRGALVGVGIGCLFMLSGSTCCIGGSASAAVVGSNLGRGASGSLCKFESFEPETRVCTVWQHDLQSDHTASDGLVAPFDGVVVRWSVVSGPVSAGTGSVKLALRAMHGLTPEATGAEVDLPIDSPPGTRHTYQERLSVLAGQPIGLRAVVANRNTQEAGVPIAFSEKDVGSVDYLLGEPPGAIWDQEESFELLLNAEIEPDQDEDGFGDLTQDCFPNHPGDQDLCGADLRAPIIRPLFAKRQAFLRKRVVIVRVYSDEAGVARAKGAVEIRGRGGQRFPLEAAHRPIAAGGIAKLSLRLPMRAVRAARHPSRESKTLFVRIRMLVSDAARNTQEAHVRIEPK